MVRSRFILVTMIALQATLPAMGQIRYDWNGASGSWQDPANWSPTGVPGVADTAIVSSGTAVLAEDAHVGVFQLSGGTIDGPGNLTVEEITWTAGTLAGEGALVIPAGRQLRFYAGTTLDRALHNYGTVIIVDYNAPHFGTGPLLNLEGGLLTTGLSGTIGRIFHPSISNAEGATIRITTTSVFAGSLRLNGGLQNYGTVEIERGTSLSMGSGTTFTNHGTVEIGTADPAAVTFSLSGGAHYGAIVVGEASQLSVAGGHNVFHEGSTVSGGGRLTVQAYYPTLTIADGALVDVGTVSVRNNVPLVIEAGGVVRAQTSFMLHEGRVRGSGTLDVSGVTTFSNNGTFAPGMSAGVLMVDGAYTMTPNAVLDVELGGYEAGTGFDQLQVSGTAGLAGTLRVSLIDDFQPAEGDRFTIITSDAVSGSFSALQLPPGLAAHVEATDHGVDLIVGMPTSTKDAVMPAHVELSVSPNPASSVAQIRFHLPSAQHVRLVVFDHLGRQVAVLADEPRAPGLHQVPFDGAPLASGLYFVRLEAGPSFQTRGLSLIR